MKKITFLERHWSTIERWKKTYGLRMPTLEAPFLMVPPYCVSQWNELRGTYLALKENTRSEKIHLPWYNVCVIVPVLVLREETRNGLPFLALKPGDAETEIAEYYLFAFDSNDDKAIATAVFVFPADAGIELLGTIFPWKHAFEWRDQEVSREEEERVSALKKLKDSIYGEISYPKEQIYALYQYTTFFFLLMEHCQNIRPLPIDTPERTAVRQHECRRKKVPYLNYHSVQIKLTGERREKEQSDRKAPATWVPLVPLHLRRGHIKSYEEGKGLFGKLHGSWWWTPRLAGHEENGISMKEYEVIP